MKTIEEYNNERKQLYIPRDIWGKSDIQCPNCGEELLIDNTSILCSAPPQKDVKCSKCDYRGYVLA